MIFIRSKKETNSFFSRRGISLVEMMIVAALSSMILLAVHKVMSKTTSTVKKGSEMLNTQLLMDMIVEKIRGDIRSMIRVESGTKANDVLTKITFDSVIRGKPVTITYEYKPKEKTLLRFEKGGEGGEKETNFRAPGKISNLSLVWVESSANELPFLSLSIQIKSDEVGEGVPPQLSFISNFFPRCLEGGALPLN